MRVSHLLTGCALAGSCGGNAPAIPPIVNPTTPHAVVGGGGQFNSNTASVTVSKEDRRYRSRLGGTVDEAATAATSAMSALGIPATTLSRSPRVVGNERIVLRRTLGGKPMSEWLDCGTTTAGVIANFYRIHAAVLMSAEPAGADSVMLEARVTAQAFSNEGASGGAVDCSSRGALEQRLLSDAASVTRK
jgi:hypothetical protein